MTHEEILTTLGNYVDYLIAGSSAEAPLWNIEKVRSGKPNKWNYVDGCMITACLSLYKTTGDEKFRWTAKRDLYDWWLHRIADEIRVGHRFYGIMTLAIYAKKCGIDEDELRRDAFALLRPYDDMSVEDINRFTKDDVVCALEMFNEDYVTFPRDDIAKLSGLTMPVNKRNWRKQPVHLEGARAIQEINDKANGTNWREGNGRPKGSGTAQARVYEWRQQHPEGRKADCHRETGLDPKTVRKWWDCPPPAVRFENGHITVRVSPSQELSDWLLDALHDGGQE